MIPALSVEPTGTAGPSGVDPPVHTIEVALSSQPYPVLIGEGSLARLGPLIRSRGVAAATKVLVVTNPAVDGFYGQRALESLSAAELEPSLLVLDAGEDQKTPASVALIHDAAQARHLERSSLIVALGGGVVGDMAGFAAATWLRGISVVQVPTTLLAMVDASIGGKTGVNHPGGKNLIGAFHQPRLVLIDPSTLATLPPREFRAGMAEVIKYGVIGDPQLFNDLEAAGDLSSLEAVGDSLLQRLLERSAAAKARVVAADEREGGLRAILNYGHTLGHVVETLCGYGTYLHGEAVALGMVAAGDLAVAMGLWSPAEQQRQCALIAKAGLPLHLPPLDPETVLLTLLSDKKVRSGTVRFVLPTAIGEVQIRNDVGEDQIRALLGNKSSQTG
ncbi:3-dehydroquinate synthase [Synechococcus sp. BA-124 BA4]|uniref:3-dehydroquinate synthase n=1 Tax=unclassified Synechococcus TaxID=2626047 RepID=UPI002AD4F07D|nr:MULTISPECIES: 3-dehydroquinate synthase [unclassified Synechococcus]MEA5399958.1 3-dehydroquinate synthase [Synechococcus sp. BA-124 BA4]CAK6699041.1 3-dehydroquinate synthase [Synechococcus sp. CBW1107]